MSEALRGVTVVDVGGTVATGYCAKLFADYGADVVNLEPAAGFPTRTLAPFVPGLTAPEHSAMHAYLSTNKRSVRLAALSARRLEALLRDADVVLAAEDSALPAAACDGVVSRIRWFGSSGPYAGFTGTDAQCFALNGMLRIIGPAEGPPLIPTGYQAQMVAGATAYVATLGQVLGRTLGNCSGPVHLETSIYEATLCFTEVAPITHFNTGLEAERRGINRLPPTYPLGVFPCKDGWIGLTVLTPRQWHAFCALLDMEEFADVPLFQSAAARGEAADLLEPVFAEKLLGFSAEELFYRGQAAAIPLARVPTMEELFQVDQFVERNAFAEARLTTGRTLTVPSVPFRLFAAPPRFGGPVATLGQHDEELGP